jgi:hypothetical protein
MKVRFGEDAETSTRVACAPQRTLANQVIGCLCALWEWLAVLLSPFCGR